MTMRIERIEASRHKRGRVLVFLEDGACLKITEQELLDFGLRAGDLLDQAALRRLKEAAGASNTKAAAADLVGRRAMSRRDLERKLREKGASEAEAHYAAEWMEAIGAINDADYAAALVRHCGEKGYGPARVREKLHEKGVPRELWEEALEALLPLVTSAKIGDCTNEEVLHSLGVGNFDLCFVCIGTNFQSSLEITSLLKEAGARFVVSKATRDIQAKFLLKNGADEVVYPERDIAERVAVRYSADNVFDYIELDEDYSIYEIPPLKEWVGKTIGEVDFRARLNSSIIGTKINGETSFLPGANHVFRAEEHLMVIGRKKDIDKILKHL